MRYLVLGPVEVANGRDHLDLGARKQRALFAVLVSRCGHVVPAATLIDALWPDDPPATAANLVQGYVGGLRRVIGADALVTRSPGYVLVEPDGGLDAAEFEALHQAGSRALGEGRVAEANDLLRQALGLWRGAAFADVVDDAGLQGEAARLDELRMTCLEHRVDTDLSLGRHGEVVAELESLVEEFPYRERLWAQLATALYACGRQADALRRLARLDDLLVEELGISPGPDIRDLERRILEHDLSPQPPPPAAPSPALPTRLRALPFERDARFVGREEELGRIRTRWELASGGIQQAVVVRGEPGIGKTSLALAAAAEAHGDGASVLFGRCDEDVLSPFQPFVEALGAALDMLDASELSAVVADHAAELSRLVPGLTARLPDSAHPGPGGPEPTMLWLVDGLAEVFARLSGQGGLVLVLDDLHWADSTTITLLRHLLRRNRQTPTLLIATYRDTDLGVDHPLADLLVEMQRSTECERIALAGFDRHEIESLLALWPDTEAEREVTADLLLRETAGNPLFIAELLRHREATGAFRPELFDPALTGVPAAIAELTAVRTRRLSESSRTALQMAAALGHRFDVRVLREAVRGHVLDVAGALEEAERAGLIHETASQGFSFTHELVRRAIHDSTSLARREELHLRAVQALEAVGDSSGETLLRRAKHARLAGSLLDQDEAATTILAAADLARESFAYLEATELYKAALELLPEDDERRPRARAQRYLTVQAAWHGFFDQASIRAAAARERGQEGKSDGDTSPAIS